MDRYNFGIGIGISRQLEENNGRTDTPYSIALEFLEHKVALGYLALARMNLSLLAMLSQCTTCMSVYLSVTYRTQSILNSICQRQVSND